MNAQETLLENFLSHVISTLDSNEIFDMMMDTLRNLLRPDGLLLMFGQKTDHVYHITRQWGDVSYEKDYCFLSDSVLAKLSASNNYIPIDNSSDDVLSALTSRQRRWIEDQDVIGFYTLKYHHAVIGFLFIINHDRTPLDASQIHYMHKIDHYASYALRNANLYQKAYRASITDDLTSLYNRKHAFQCIENYCTENRNSTLILLDIDDFRLYNELYSVKEGDNLIHRCAQIILQELNDTDMAFRFGADEFMILREGCDVAAAKELAHHIIECITKSHLTTDMIWDITITCGITTFPEISEDANSFLHNVEQAVYYGKLEGKGHMAVYRRGMEDRSQNPDIRAAYERVAPTIYALTAAIDAKDNYTFIHSMNVSKYAVMLAETIGMNANDIEIIRDAGMLHDIGKISIPEHILKKTAYLTNEEYEIMKTHVENSTKMIRYLPDMDYVIPAVVGHHERYDGKGYPRGLAGEEIPLMARILTIADCFDAMTARRPYKQPMPVSYAISELQNHSGTQFDPELVTEFVSLIYEGKIAV